MEIYRVELNRKVHKRLKKIPEHVLIKLMAWVECVGENGLQFVRCIPGYHDEPLVGRRRGQRSIRLSRQYRAIYQIDRSGDVHIIEIIEVNSHEY